MLFFLLVTAAYSRIVAVVEVCRHGARSPIHFMPWDNLTVWPEGAGELTPEGMRQHYLLGTQLRKMYIQDTQLLMPNYLQPLIYVYSDDYTRTLMSAESQIQGLFPHSTGFNLTSGLAAAAVPPINVTNLANLQAELGLNTLPNASQVIPIHSDSQSRQLNIAPEDSCSYYISLSNYKMSLTSQLNEIYSRYNDVINDIMTNMTVSRAEAQSISRQVSDSLVANRFLGRPFPLNFNQAFLTRLQALSMELDNYEQLEPDFMARLGGTGMLNQILNNLQSTLSGSSSVRFYLYSGHDTTISIILAFLQMDYSQPPPFASTLLFELHQYKNTYYVNIKYNGVLMSIPTCGVNCTFNDFQRYIDIRAIADYASVCSFTPVVSSWNKTSDAVSDKFKLPGTNEDNELRWFFWVSFAFYLAFAIIVVVLLFGLSAGRKKKFVSNEESMLTMKN